MKENTTVLIKGCRKGDRKSQLALFEAYLPYVTSICKRYLFDKSLLEDVVQETFLLVFKGIGGSFDEKKGAFKPWLRKIAINTSIKFNERYRGFVSLDSNANGAAFQVNARALQQVSGKEILQLIASIPTAYRDVFNLYAIDGYSHKEIADLLGISIDSSRKKLQRARIFLQKNIEGKKKINRTKRKYGINHLL